MPYLVILDATRRYLPLQIAVQSMRVAAVAVGALVGGSILAVAAALVVVELVRAILSQRLIAQLIAPGAPGLAKALAISLPPAVLALAAAAAVQSMLGPASALVLLPLAALAAVIAWIPGLFLMRHPLADELRHLAAALWRRRRRSCA